MVAGYYAGRGLDAEGRPDPADLADLLLSPALRGHRGAHRPPFTPAHVFPQFALAAAARLPLSRHWTDRLFEL